jgi:glucose-6-phosphate isomerase
MTTNNARTFNKQFDQTHSFHELKILAQSVKEMSLKQSFEQDPERANKMSINCGDLYYDYAKHLVDDNVLKHLFAMATQQNLPQKIEQLFKGAHVNTTEDRPAWHSALRQVVSQHKSELPQRVVEKIESAHQQMQYWVDALNGGFKGATGKPIKDIIHLGIGGSDLGPRFLNDALKEFHESKLKIHFVANIDPQAMLDCFEVCQPESTMFILASKSFTTQETLENAELAKNWLKTKIKTADLPHHFLGISANVANATKWGLKENHILPLWDWVGGRFSVWSSIALPVAIKIGMKNFTNFLKGGYAMDKHFREAPLSENIPVVMALLGIWYNNFLNMSTNAVLPYSHRLKYLPDYLQQLDMESNGKSTQICESPVSYNTGTILWGQAGTNGQHAFYQLLHQGTHKVPADFIVIAKALSEPKQHNLLLAHGLAQTRALMLGQVSANQHEYMQGNRPSSTIVLKELSPKTLGMLIALYEHKVYVQGVMWNINSFDQPGVQLGKVLAKEVYEKFEGDQEVVLDSSTANLLSKISQFQQEK